MEGQMDTPINTKKPDFGSDHYKVDAEFRRVADTTCYWFAAARCVPSRPRESSFIGRGNSEFTYGIEHH